jgi:hypothetical protein
MFIYIYNYIIFTYKLFGEIRILQYVFKYNYLLIFYELYNFYLVIYEYIGFYEELN